MSFLFLYWYFTALCFLYFFVLFDCLFVSPVDSLGQLLYELIGSTGSNFCFMFKVVYVLFIIYEWFLADLAEFWSRMCWLQINWPFIIGMMTLLGASFQNKFFKFMFFKLRSCSEIVLNYGALTLSLGSTNAGV